MTETTDLGSSFCSVTPFDQSQYPDNILDRIEALERAVQELQSQNVSANQLSDISQNVGWTYGVTYMGQPGWTQTEYGTLIPPPGVSLSSLGLLMSDGNPYQFVSTDSDGVLHFGINPSGGTSGSAAGITDYIIMRITTQSYYPDWTATNDYDFSSTIYNVGSTFSWDSHHTISFPAGLYYCGGFASVECVTNAQYQVGYGGDIRKQSDNSLLYTCGEEHLVNKASGGTIPILLTPSLVFYTSVAAEFQMGLSAGNPGGDITGTWTITKLA